MRWFRTEKEERVNLVEHTKKVISENQNVRIYVGCDSQDYGQETKFVTVVCYRWEGRKGAHYIYLLEREKRYRDTYTRLYQEGVKSLEVLSILQEIPFLKIEAVEFDFNNIKETISTKLISTFRGWCDGLGQKSIFKGGEMIATKAADHKVRGR